MAKVYKTPGVFIEEIPKLPPSVAQVETAIPAFIGYTEKADQFSANDLHNKPFKISSFIEYQLYYGDSPALDVTEVKLDANSNLKSASLNNTLFMYDAVRMFYDNGGGDCFIVSVNLYQDPKSKADFLDGLNGLRAIEKEDEPTMLVFPDNSVLTNGNDYYEVYQQALLQCQNLGDRFTIMDVKKTDYTGADFRNNIGMTALKYGATYTPWLKTLFPKSVRYRDFMNDATHTNRFVKESTPINLNALTTITTPVEITTKITNLDIAIAENNTVKADFDNLNGAFNTLAERYNALEATLQSTRTASNLEAVMSFLFSIARSVDARAAAVSDTNLLQTNIRSQISLLRPSFEKLIGYDQEADNEMTDPYDLSFSDAVVPTEANWGTIFSGPAPVSTVISGADDAARINGLIPLLRTEFDVINNIYMSGIVSMADATEKEADSGLAKFFPAYNNILLGIQNTPVVVPPSGAAAGIYARTDRTRGVWKAPANETVLGIIGPDAVFNAGELDALNVDTTAGKSINAIRSFTGKGTLVFGARTLAGNDNEWRYVSVRRFFNMVEESCKKSTEPFVFEPNDANTWVKVQGMLENFLNTLWRQGALQGAKPEHAFYVAVGLGKTMTSLDILEGRMIVEIGMAVVRPAEFIILRFSHKLAES